MYTVYKILTKSNKKYYSFLKKNFKGHAKTNILQRYYTNRFIYPKIGKLFAFDTFEAAKIWFWNCDNIANYVITEVETTTKPEIPQFGEILTYRSACTSIDALHRFWDNPNKYKSGGTYLYDLTSIPKGTVFCTNLKIKNILI